MAPLRTSAHGHLKTAGRGNVVVEPKLSFADDDARVRKRAAQCEKSTTFLAQHTFAREAHRDSSLLAGAALNATSSLFHPEHLVRIHRRRRESLGADSSAVA